MKMKPEHFEYLRAAIGAFDSEQARAEYRAKGLTLKRYQWDLTYMARLTPFICESLYPYLNDTHVQTALNRIVPEL